MGKFSVGMLPVTKTFLFGSKKENIGQMQIIHNALLIINSNMLNSGNIRANNINIFEKMY